MSRRTALALGGSALALAAFFGVREPVLVWLGDGAFWDGVERLSWAVTILGVPLAFGGLALQLWELRQQVRAARRELERKPAFRVGFPPNLNSFTTALRHPADPTPVTITTKNVSAYPATNVVIRYFFAWGAMALAWDKGYLRERFTVRHDLWHDEVEVYQQEVPYLHPGDPWANRLRLRFRSEPGEHHIVVHVV